MEQASGLRLLMERRVNVAKVRFIQSKLRKSIMKGKADKVNRLMLKLEQAQRSLEKTY